MIRIGLIGAGKNGQGNIKRLAAHTDRCQITAVADPMIEGAQQVAQEYGAKAFADYNEFYDEVDAVVISTPNWLHPDNAIDCAKAGKHVWIEKPMALTTADADRMAAAIAAAKVQSMVGFSVRFGGVNRTLTQHLRDGKLGEVVSITSRRLCNFGGAPSNSWRFDYEKSGGVMSELMVHEMDWVVDAVGVPDRIVARKASRYNNDPRDNEHVWLQMDFGAATGTIEGSQMSTLPDFFKAIIGSEAAVSTRNWGNDAWLSKDGDSSQLENLPDFDKHEHFLDIIDGRCASVADVHYGRMITAIAERTIASAVSGDPVDCRDLQTAHSNV